jgi:hypothetical protein
MKNKTAVEWLQKQLSNKIYTSIEDYNTQSKLAFEEAKELEKQQHQETATHFFPTSLKKEDFEQYYNETYNK